MHPDVASGMGGMRGPSSRRALPLMLLAGALLSACGAHPPPSVSVPADTVAAAAGDPAFARMLAGFHQCRYEGLFVNDLPGQVATAPDTDWFRAHPGAACGRDADFYYFCMDERYRGLTVQRMALPGTGGLPSVALYLQQDAATARSILRQQLGGGFPSSPASDAGTAPELMADPADANRSILVCTRTF